MTKVVMKNSLFGIVVFCLVLLSCSRKNEKSLLSHEESDLSKNLIRNIRYNQFIDQRFRLKSDHFRSEDYNEYLELFFIAWLTDREAFDVFCRFGHNHINNLHSVVKTQLAKKDALDIKRFGEIEFKISDNNIAFYSRVANGGKVRLRLLDRVGAGYADDISGNSYEKLNNDFETTILSKFNFGSSKLQPEFAE